jgi:hypothetical protein
MCEIQLPCYSKIVSLLQGPVIKCYMGQKRLSQETHETRNDTLWTQYVIL